jgi:hypothetical protein
VGGSDSQQYLGSGAHTLGTRALSTNDRLGDLKMVPSPPSSAETNVNGATPPLHDTLSWFSVIQSQITCACSVRPNKKYKAIPATGHGNLEASICLDSQLIDGVKAISLKRRRRFTLSKMTCTHFCCNLSRTQDHSAEGKIRSIDKGNRLVGLRNHDLTLCSIEPQVTTRPQGPFTTKKAVSLLAVRYLCSEEDW